MHARTLFMSAWTSQWHAGPCDRQLDCIPHSACPRPKKDGPEALDPVVKWQGLSHPVEGLGQLVGYNTAGAGQLHNEQQGTEDAELVRPHHVDDDAVQSNEGEAHVPAHTHTSRHADRL